MKIYNLRIEEVTSESVFSKKTDNKIIRLACDFEAKYTNVKELYFCVDSEYADCLTADVYDAFLVALLYPAMYYNEDILIEGNVSKRLYFNIVNYIQAIIRDYGVLTHQVFHNVNIKVDGFKNAEKNERLRVGTGFSGGGDSFSTLVDRFYNCHDDAYKISTLFFFHLGQYGNIRNPLTHERVKNRYSITHDYGRKVGLETVFMNSNLFEIYKPEWELFAGLLVRITAVLVFQKSLQRYYMPGDIWYKERFRLGNNQKDFDLAVFADPIVMPLLSPEGLDILVDGEQNSRSQRVERITSNSEAHCFLNVCVNSSDEHLVAKNCSECSKCLATMFALESLGHLEDFKLVFDLNKWNRLAFGYKCKCLVNYKNDYFLRDCIDLAREKQRSLPPLWVAYLYLIYDFFAKLPKRIKRRVIKFWGNSEVRL